MSEHDDIVIHHGQWPRLATEEKLRDLLKLLTVKGKKHVVSLQIICGEVVALTSSEQLVGLLEFLKSDAGYAFTQLTDICGVDYPEREQRFDVVYHLLSISKNLRLRVKVVTDEATPVPSVVDVFPAAGWFERECWDMYGVLFSGNPDLRRILTDYGFDGHPQRRDFPLTGYVELRYDEEKKKVVYEPVKLQQAYRDFDYLSPWEGVEYPLPGDEKAS